MNNFYIHPADLSPLPFFFFFFGKNSSLKIKLPGLVFSMISYSDHRFLVVQIGFQYLRCYACKCTAVLEPHMDHGCTQWVLHVCGVRGWLRKDIRPIWKKKQSWFRTFSSCFSWQRKLGETLLFSNSSQYFGLTNEWGLHANEFLPQVSGWVIDERS